MPKEWADKYKGKFDMGWDEYREIVHQRQLDMGIIPAGHRAVGARPRRARVGHAVRPTRSGSTARIMEVYAGFVSFTDHHFGRILDFLKEIGELDNTLIMVVSDNGASSEGGPVGSLNEMFFFNNAKESLEDNLEMIDKLGGVETCNHYPWGWTNAGNTPVPPLEARDLPGRHHRPVHRVVAQGHPGRAARCARSTRTSSTSSRRCLEALGIEAPESIRGVTQAPIDGISFAHTFNDAAAPSNHHTQYFEMFGHRSIYHDGWRAVCPWPGPSFTEAAKKGRQFGSPIPNEVLVDIETHDWELYHVDEDYSETHNLAAEHRDKLIEMIGRWWAEAGKYQVLPIDGDVPQPPQRGTPDDRQAEEQDRLSTPAGRRSRSPPRPRPTTGPGASRPTSSSRRAAQRVCCWPRAAAPVVTPSSSRTRSCTSCTTGSAVTSSGCKSDATVPEGEVELRYEFEPTGKPDLANGHGVPARGQLYINRKLVASIDMPFSILVMFGTEGLTCGYDGGDPVAAGGVQR